ncbi:MAG: hypothetical protein K6G18_08315 [Treponema sp.]|nr:hypothetical protein [Treponema sp.]
MYSSAACTEFSMNLKPMSSSRAFFPRVMPIDCENFSSARSRLLRTRGRAVRQNTSRTRTVLPGNTRSFMDWECLTFMISG